VEVDEGSSLLDADPFVIRGLVGAEALFVFEEVVDVGVTQAAEPPAVEEVVAELGQVPGNLEVDEVGLAVVAEEDVLGLVGIDVGDVAAMQLGEKLVEIGEEGVGDGLVPGEGAAGDEGVEEPGGADQPEDGGDGGEVGAGAVEAGFAAAEEFAGPIEGDAGVGLGAADLEDGAGSIEGLVEPGSGPEVVLDGLGKVEGGAVGGMDEFGEILSAQRAEGVGGGALAGVLHLEMTVVGHGCIIAKRMMEHRDTETQRRIKEREPQTDADERR
jgi:hypothetical protein